MELSPALEWVLGVILGALAVWKIFDFVKLSVWSGKAAPVLEKIAVGMKSASVIAAGFGLEKVANVIKEAADPVDEAGDTLQLFSDLTADGDFTKEELKSVLDEGKDVWIEAKDFRVKIIPKKDVVVD